MPNFEEAMTVDPVFSDKSLKAEHGEEVKKFSEITDQIITAFNNAGDTIPTGLLYGRIQSGKTRTMIMTSALAIDRKFKVILVLTTDINDLVLQTYNAFKKGLPGVKVISKAELNDMDGEVELLKSTLPNEGNSVVIICSKGPAILQKVITFLGAIGAEQLPALIFDDEGDQATLDTSTGRRSRTGTDVEPSKIFSLIHSRDLASLKRSLPKAIFVSVTGTPQALFLQNRDSETRPAFIRLIPPGKGYVGGDVFFANENPASNKYILIVDEDEVNELLGEEDDIPSGLAEAIDFFVVSATLIGLERGWNEYNMLAHPSLNRFDHSLVKRKITTYVNDLLRILNDHESEDYARKIKQLRKVYDEVVARSTKTPPFTMDEVIMAIKRTLPQRQVFVINSDRRGPAQSPSRSYNFLIGGNSVGRGLAIKNLLVTYYTRSPRSAQMDTMHQHARMFGYRQKTLQYTKVFLPTTLYTRFYWIHNSDNAMRKFIDKHSDDMEAIIVPTNRGEGLRPTRNNVIDLGNVDIILPGSQVHPGRPIIEAPKANTIRKRTEKILAKHFPDYKESGHEGIVISTDIALQLIDTIKSHPQAARSHKLMHDYLNFLKNIKAYGPNVRLRFRESDRSNISSGALPRGIIGGPEQTDARELKMPTLWIFLVKGSKSELRWSGVDFIYPTIIAPNRKESLYANIS
ncbi:MAG TPA: Z1 domain-containing protein [Candidatus Saccharimonadales bacterium]|nr:Z1 domain-containing protein [Candidatus Saccharimonadales bacterium]